MRFSECGLTLEEQNNLVYKSVLEVYNGLVFKIYSFYVLGKMWASYTCEVSELKMMIQGYVSVICGG